MLSTCHVHQGCLCDVSRHRKPAIGNVVAGRGRKIIMLIMNDGMALKAKQDVETVLFVMVVLS